MPRKRKAIIVRALHSGARNGQLCMGSLAVACALGRSGRRVLKREGDGATPVGRFTVREAFYRSDRVGRPKTRLKLRPIRPQFGWCDAPEDRNYNRRVTLPYAASAERLWREDGLYDLLVVLDYNDRPRVRGRGSAVFLHIAGDGLAPTAGCVALRRADALRLLGRLAPGDCLIVPA